MGKIEKIEQLLNEVNTIADSYERVAEATGENFNIFSILGMETDEVATHSRFIAELLNPKGRHGQKDVFLDKFIDYLKNKLNNEEVKGTFYNYNKLLNEFDTLTAKVRVEVSIGKVSLENGGRLDILIEDGFGKVIMIENKIYAGEQKNQLLRYKNAFPNGILIYLTLNGDDSNEPSSKEIDYLRYSYKDDVIKWLEDCKKESASIPILRESITQYINLSKKLTNQNLNKKMNKDIIDKIIKGGHLKSYKILFDLKDEISKSLIREIILKTKDNLEKDQELLHYKLINFELVNINNKGRGRLLSFQNEILKKHDLSIRLNLERNYSDLIFGFYSKTNKTKNEKLCNLFIEKFDKGVSSILYPSYTFYENHRTWWLNDLDNIYKNQNDFYIDLKEKIITMLEIIKEYDN